MEFEMVDILAHYNFDPEDFNEMEFDSREKMDVKKRYDKKLQGSQYRNRNGTRGKRANVTRGEEWFEDLFNL